MARLFVAGILMAQMLNGDKFEGILRFEWNLMMRIEGSKS
jgi:hypothetical protein